MKSFSKFSLIAIGIASMSFAAFDGILEQLNIRQADAQSYIFNNLVGSFRNEQVNVENSGSDANSVYSQLKHFQIPKIKLSTIASGNKAAAATELCEYIKTYVSSKEFAAQYAKKRNAAKPTSEPYRMDAATLKSMKDALKESEANLTKMKAQKLPASAIQQMEASVAQQKKQIADQSDPTPNLSLWEKMYPEDAATMVTNQLKEYLALAKTVDFEAALTTAGKYKKFSNPAYEAKSLKWKAIYRAGPEVNNAVNKFVNEWLKEGVKSNVASMPKSTGSSAVTKENKPATIEEAVKNETGSGDNAKKLEKPKKAILNKLKNKAKTIID